MTRVTESPSAPGPRPVDRPRPAPRSTGPVFALAVLGTLGVLIVTCTCLYLPRFGAPVATAEVIEVIDRPAADPLYRIRFEACDSLLVGEPGRHVLGDVIAVRHLACNEIWDASDSLWWWPYLVTWLMVGLLGALAVIAWCRPELLVRRWAMRRGPR